MAAALLALATSAGAASLVLAPERAVSPITPAPAASLQWNASVAVNASDDAIAIWCDLRLRTATSIFGTRLTKSGKPLDAFTGPFLLDAYSAEIASAGDEFLVVYNDFDGFWSQRVDADMKPLGGRVQLDGDPGSSVLAAASDGRTYLAVADKDGSLQALLLDLAGRIIDTRSIPLSAVSSSPRVIVSGGKYHVIRAVTSCSTTCAPAIEDVSVEDSGATASRILETTAAESFGFTAVGNEQSILVEWVTVVPGSTPTETVEYEVFGANGSRSGRIQSWSAAVGSDDMPAFPVALWDGRQFLPMWQYEFGMQLIGQRVAADGSLVDRSPFVVHEITSGGAPYVPAFATARFHDGSNLVLWSDDNDVFSLPLRAPIRCKDRYRRSCRFRVPSSERSPWPAMQRSGRSRSFRRRALKAWPAVPP